MWIRECIIALPVFCRWERDPGDIDPGRTPTGCPRTLPGTPRGQMCSILRKRRTTQVLWTGKPLSATHRFARLIAMPLQDNKSPFLFSVCCFSLSAPPLPIPRCSHVGDSITSAITAGCKDEGSVARARTAAAQTALALWIMTAESPAQIIFWMVRSYSECMQH